MIERTAFDRVTTDTQETADLQRMTRDGQDNTAEQLQYRIHLDLHCPEWHDSILSAFDPCRIVSTIAKTGASGMVAFAKDCYGNAFYDTKIGHRHKCIGDRDLLAETLVEAKKHGIGIYAYYCTIWDNHAAESHPEWRMRGADGRYLCDAVTNEGERRWQYLCHNGGFADMAEAMVEEIVQHYDIDGFHLDMFNMEFKELSCYCDVCRSLFREKTGKEIPTEPTWDETWRQFLEFRYASVERYMRRLRDVVHKSRPGLPVIMNYHASPNFDWRPGQMPVRHSVVSDIATGETYTPLFGDMYPGLESRYLTSMHSHRPVELVSWRMNRITDYTVKPTEQLRWELLTTLAHGASVMLIDQPFHDGRLDEYAYEQIAGIFGEIESKRKWFGGQRLKHVGLYYSCKTRDLHGRLDQKPFLLPVMGAYKALVESQIECAFVFDETATLERLRQYPVVFLPNIAVMDANEVAMFEQYVKEGGTLIATLDTSRYSRDGEELADFQLAGVLGLNYEALLDCDACYLRGLPEPFTDDIDPRQYVLTPGTVRRVKPTTAHGLGNLHDSFFKKRLPDQFFSHSMHPPYTRESDAVYVNEAGKGRAIYLPCGLDAAYADTHESREHRILLRNIIQSAGHKPATCIKAPLNVESTTSRRGNQLLIHLLAFNPIRQALSRPCLDEPVRPSIRMEEAPMYRVSVDLNVPFQSARAFNSNSTLAVRSNRLELLCEDVHEIIIIDLA